MNDVVTSRGKIYKLVIHQKQFSELDLIINLKDYPDLKDGDVVEVYHPKDEFNRLLLQVKECPEDLQQKDSISIERSIATNFNLKIYKDVIVNPVNPKNVALDLVELVYKEQYFSRADMWRLKQCLVNSCIYLGKKIPFAEMRVQTNELWSKGEKVTCGVLTEDTRVTFRSSTAQVNIFIQMSSEMWEFDNYGDLYFEKAIGGFLVELFSQWKEKNCNHDVTITLFSRTFYDASSIEDFPMHMRECVQRDNQGRFYEDFYRVVVQNERYDDWTPTVIQLKKLFLQYLDQVIYYHNREGCRPLRAWNSSASQGNFLEVLNMALNAFEKFYLDRSFDRTGKLSIVITPGTGVFEVDRELMNITKQRTIDCGNGSDLVCMGEQPLHAVPLFKFHSKKPKESLFTSDVGDDYNIPHWINHSFYTSKCQAERLSACKFMPRIKIPQEQDEHWKSSRRTPTKRRLSATQAASLNSQQGDVNFPFVEYDDYDAQIFKIPNQRTLKQSMSVVPSSNSRKAKSMVSRWHSLPKRVPRIRCNSDITRLIPEENSPKLTTKAISIPKSESSVKSDAFMSNSFGGCSSASTEEDVFITRPVIGSAGSPVGHQGQGHNLAMPNSQRRALINPFAPSRLHFKVTSNRRRWAHAFPTDPHGASIQLHHIHSSGTTMSEHLSDSLAFTPTREALLTRQMAVEVRMSRGPQTSESSDGFTVDPPPPRTKTVSSIESGSEDSMSVKDQAMTNAGSRNVQNVPSTVSLPKVDSASSLGSMHDLHPGSAGSASRIRNSWTLGFSQRSHYYQPDHHTHTQHLPRSIEEGHNWLWGTTGEQEWTPETTTGMDWKSMTMPASLPITTDYFPDKRSLQTDYLMSDYGLLPDDVNSEWQTSSSSVRKPLTTAQVYRELIAQRIAQGFQLVILPKRLSRQSEITNLSSSPYQQAGSGVLMRARSKVELVEEHVLSIGRIFHKLTMNGNNIKVQRYWPRHPYPKKSIHYTYRFQVPDSDSYDVSWTNFSYEKLENYNWNYVDIYILTRGEEDFSLMESLKYWRARFCLLPSNDPATKKIIDNHPRCDIYEEIQEQEHLIDGFLRFIEIMNKIKRPVQSRKPKMPLLRCHSVSVAPTTVPTMPPEKEKKNLPGLPRCFTMSAAQKPTLKFLKEKKKQMAVRRHSLTQSPVLTGSGGEKLDPRLVESMSKQKGAMKEMIDSPPPSSVASPSQTSVDVKKSALSSGSTELTPTGGNLTLLKQESMPLPDKSLTIKSSVRDIRDAMLEPTEGLSFLNHQPGLPSLPAHTFVAAEAVTWVRNNIDGAKDLGQAIQILQTMIDEQLICHASGNPRHRFIYGFFLYHVIKDADKKRDITEMYRDTERYKDKSGRGVSGKKRADQDINSLQYLSNYYYNTSFQYEWCEVAVHVDDAGDRDPCGSVFLQNSLPSHQVHVTNSRSKSDKQSGVKTEHDWGGRSTHSAFAGATPSETKTMGTPELMLDLTKLSNSGASPMYKVVNVDVDPTKRSDREEWGTARYHGNYCPSCAFELEVQWLVATGCIMGELVQVWSRKASSYGFHFLPIPGDPFALPFNMNSDPLRGPIFVPLNIECLLDPDGEQVFEAFDPSTREERMLMLQEAILKRFGFMPDRCLPKRSGVSFGDEGPPQYVHCTGGMFVLIPDNKATSPRNRDGTHRKPTVGTYLDYVIHQRQRSQSFGEKNVSPENMSLSLQTESREKIGSDINGEHPQEGLPLIHGRVGFLWAWNYMLNKKWRTSSTGDESFQDKMLADFRAFCSNDENRLREYWDTCRQEFLACSMSFHGEFSDV